MFWSGLNLKIEVIRLRLTVYCDRIWKPSNSLWVQKPGFFQNLWLFAKTVSETRFLKSPLTRFEWLITGWVVGGESLLRALLGVGEEGNE
jgi:hypothetical protein